MLGMENSEKRAQAEFFIKYGALVISAVWILVAGTAFLDRQTKSLELRNKYFGIESNPTASTDIDAIMNNVPWIGNEEYCTVTGQYRIKNIGRLNFVIDSVTFQLFEVPTTTFDDVNNQQVTSLTLMKRVESLEPIHEETIEGSETVGVENELQRSFGFVIRERPNHLYTVVANATGGLPENPGYGDDTELGFGDRDLQHFTGLVDICGSMQTPPS